jgi:hypothetical protein
MTVELAAKRERRSVSSWAREHLAAASRDEPDWPEGYFEKLANMGGTAIEESGEIEVPLDEITIR